MRRPPVAHAHPRSSPACAATAGERHGGRPGRLWIGQKAVQNARQIEPREDAGNLVAGKDVRGYEASQRRAQPLLLVRDDRGVRDRDA